MIDFLWEGKAMNDELKLMNTSMNETQFRKSILDYFENLPDPRIDRAKKHKLIDIVAISLCATIAYADGFEDIEVFGKTHRSWFETFLELPNGIPSHDTFARVFAALDPVQFQQCFNEWTQDIAKLFDSSKHIAIDGKTVRRSHDKRRQKAPIHLVSAWANGNSLILGQVKTTEKSNEITAIPALLEMLDTRGVTFTIDAIACQKDIVATIIKKEADYILALKGNQATLHEDVKLFFEEAQKHQFKDLPCEYHRTDDKGHGRLEVRHHWTTTHIDWLLETHHWTGLKSIGMVTSERTINGKTSTETRYFISSLQMNAETFARLIRSHWSIENNLHWVLDVTFREDESRIRKKNAAENMCLMRRVALSLLKQENSKRRSLKAKRKLAGWSTDYLAIVLGGAK